MKILKHLRRLVTPEVVKSTRATPSLHALSRPEPAPRQDPALKATMIALHALGTDDGHALAMEIQRGVDRRQGRLREDQG